MIYSTTVKIRFREADPAGILFFGQIAGITHDVFEEFVQHIGFSWKEWFSSGPWGTPIRHLSCDFRAPFFPGQTYEVQVSTKKIGESSFTMHYQYQRDDKIHAVVEVVHAIIDGNTFTKRQIPQIIVERLSPYRVS
jgi:acyl-CoA thioester hydrolase/1,4-dihydroxy-2-naphthoyl-CoA hydrolase